MNDAMTRLIQEMRDWRDKYNFDRKDRHELIVAINSLKVLDSANHSFDTAFAKVIMKAGAGVCSMSVEGKHEFLKDIVKIGAEMGYDMLGAKK